MNIAASLLEMGFTVLDEIGQGGYARVFTVSWVRYPNQIFVAKVISVPESKQKMGEQSYLNEINTLRSLYHKNIIQIYKHFIIHGHMVIIMEYCEKGSLHNDITKNGPLDAYSFRSIAKDILSAVAYCHENMIAHRDIKPGNILLDGDNQLKLCDFGLSDPTKSRYTCLHDGSLGFAAPELIINAFYDPKKADIFSIGVTFYFLVMGKLPWISQNGKDLREEILHKEIEFPLRSNVPPTIKALIVAMTRKNPNTRPTAEALLKHEFFDHLPTLKLASKIRKSVSNGSCESFSLTTHLFKVNKAYTCRLQSTPHLMRSSNAL